MNNLKIQAQNQVPTGFPTFIRKGFDVKIIGEGFQVDQNGLIFQDFEVGNGDAPNDNQQVVFDYTGYNENGGRIDSSYRKGEAAKVQLGRGGLIPGFELALKGMKVGGKRRVIIPPNLGPPVGPSTFFSAKQCEVFDIELRQIKDCKQQQLAMFSRTVCE
eukprot:g4927.t1